MNQQDEPRKHAGQYCASGLCCTRVENFSVVIRQYEILKNVSLHIHCGELTAIIGSNGAGKTTLLKAILGEVPHTGELIFLDEKDRHTGRPQIGYVPQKLEFDLSTPISVFDLFVSALTNRPVWLFHPKDLRAQVLDSLTRVDAAQVIDRRLGALSGGELQRVLLALALNPMPDLVLLDEPVAGIDHNGLKLFYKTVSDLRTNYDLSILLVSHDLDLVAQYADRVVVLNNKTVEAVGTPREVFSDRRTIELFGLNPLGCEDGGEGA